MLNGDDGPDEVMTLSGELARLEARIAELETELMAGDVAAAMKVLRQLGGPQAGAGRPPGRRKATGRPSA